jgi:hypothetical protein
MNLSARFSSTRWRPTRRGTRGRTIAIAILGGFLLVLPSCIPALRPPEPPAQPMPADDRPAETA